MTQAHESNQDGATDPLAELRREVACLRSAEERRARRTAKALRVAGLAGAAAVFGLGVAMLPSTVFSSPGQPAACGAEHADTLYCLPSGQFARPSYLNSNFEVLADDVDTLEGDLTQLGNTLDDDVNMLNGKIANHTHPSPLSWSSHFLQYGQSARLDGYTSANSVCFVGRMDVHNLSSGAAKCQAYVSGDQWLAYTEGSVLCNIYCLKW